MVCVRFYLVDCVESGLMAAAKTAALLQVALHVAVALDGLCPIRLELLKFRHPRACQANRAVSNEKLTPKGERKTVNLSNEDAKSQNFDWTEELKNTPKQQKTRASNLAADNEGCKSHLLLSCESAPLRLAAASAFEAVIEPSRHSTARLKSWPAKLLAALRAV